MHNNVATRYRLYPKGGWRQWGYYCMHCDARANKWANNDDLSAIHAKECIRTQKNLKARTGLVRALENRYEAYHQNINS